jgi:hypothetical protein
MRKDLVEWWVEYDPGNREEEFASLSRSVHTSQKVRKCPVHPLSVPET